MFTRTKNSIILVLGLLGTSMSGYLSYWVLFGPSCHAGPIPWLNCGSRVIKLVGVPTCVFGFFMFLTVVIMIAAAWEKRNVSAIHKALLVVATVGVLFSASLSVYEIWIIKLQKLPACVYGFFFYLGIFLTTVMSFKKAPTQPPPQPSIPS